ncbi:MAG: 6,7-dimethyl-8-ribityllumazine synthase [bacterium]|nr:6,7-dimethyl-8-ribityllumazine synthase [bacterium]
MAEVISGNLIATKKKFGIVVSRFNEFISKSLLEGALDTLTRHGADDKDIKIVWVPGAFEISYAAGQLMKANKFDAVICLGTIIRGDTPHFDYIAGEAAKSIAHLSLHGDTPVIYGVITSDNLEQAIERAGTKAGNKGRDAALTAIEMANLYLQINKK